MKSSGIGGQAVIEGIMMRNKDKYAIAVRKPDEQIEVTVKESHLLTEKHKWLNYPVIRGIFNFLDSLVTGVSTINYSASLYDDPAEQKATKMDEVGKAIFKDKQEAVLMAVTIVFSIAFALALFMILPYYISRIFAKYIVSQFLLNFLEGIIKVVIFIIYIVAISKMNDIKRTFMYHGAEHKCINCIENGAKLTPQNVKNSSRYHKRCGTSFLFFVVFLSVIFFIFIRVDNTILQVVIRLLLVPVIAGVSYEIIRWAGKNNNVVENIISKPGVWLQRLTTKEPDMDMIEVAIEAVNAVFDSEAFLAEYYQDSENPEADMEAKANELALSANLIVGVKRNSRAINPDDIPEELKSSSTVSQSDDLLDHIDFEDEPMMEDLSEEHPAKDSVASDQIQNSDSQELEPGVQADLSVENQQPETTEESTDGVESEHAESDRKDAKDHVADQTEANVDHTEETDDTDESAGIIFEDEDDSETLEEDETCADDVPLFKQKETEN